jgi:hypothetical protein
MKYWFDTEFLENGDSLDIISLAFVSEDGRELYLVNNECDYSRASSWVIENVLAPIGLDHRGYSIAPDSPDVHPLYLDSCARSFTRAEIAHKVALFLGCVEEIKTVSQPQSALQLLLAQAPSWAQPLISFTGLLNTRLELKSSYAIIGSTPELWAYYSSFDWRAFCHLFGATADLPRGFPMFCRDVRQERSKRNYPRLPERSDLHSALDKARWNKNELCKLV